METNYRGELYIHASKTKSPIESKELRDLVENISLNYEHIICKCNLVDCVYMTKEYVEEIKNNNYKEYICGNYEEGRYAWILEDIEPLENSIKAKGQLSIWNYYEQISENIKILWKENFNLENKKYTQVSGYIFNNKNELLIVKNKTAWTIPGGHPEVNETPIETLSRGIMEEACVKIKEINYLGAVEVVEGTDTYYQLRYTAKVDEILPFIQEWEIYERKFINLKDLKKYITWSDGITFKEQVNSAKKFWNI